jgi:hypothetical protein
VSSIIVETFTNVVISKDFVDDKKYIRVEDANLTDEQFVRMLKYTVNKHFVFYVDEEGIKLLMAEKDV